MPALKKRVPLHRFRLSNAELFLITANNHIEILKPKYHTNSQHRIFVSLWNVTNQASVVWIYFSILTFQVPTVQPITFWVFVSFSSYKCSNSKIQRLPQSSHKAAWPGPSHEYPTPGTYLFFYFPSCCCDKTLWPKAIWGEKDLYSLDFQGRSWNTTHIGWGIPTLSINRDSPIWWVQFFSWNSPCPRWLWFAPRWKHWPLIQRGSGFQSWSFYLFSCLCSGNRGGQTLVSQERSQWSKSVFSPLSLA